MPLGAGLRQPWEVPTDPREGVSTFTGTNPAANTGLAGLAPDFSDAATMGQAPFMGRPPGQGFSAQEMAGLQQFTTQPMPVEAAPTQQGRILFDPSRNQFLINNVTVDADDIEYLRRAEEYLQEPITTEIPEGNWRTSDLNQINATANSLLNLTVGDRLRTGTRGVGQAFAGGTGRLLNILGLEDAGDGALRLAERIGPTEKQQARSAAVAEANTLWQNMRGAAVEGAPSFGFSIGSAIAGGRLGFTLGGPKGAVLGAGAGAFASIFPMMVSSAYESAAQQQGTDYAESSAGTQAILTTALATTVVQTLAPTMVASRVLNLVAQNAARNVVGRALSGRVAAAGTIGITEAFAEASAYLIDQMVFDPAVRSAASPEEIRALWPYMVAEHGEQTVIAAFAGFALGGTAGAITGNPRLREAARAEENVETDLKQVSEENAVRDEVIESMPVPTGLPAGMPEFTGDLRGVGPQGVLPMSGLGGQIERARRSRDVDRGPLPTDQEVNLLDRPVVDPAQQELGFGEEFAPADPVRETALGAGLTRELRQREFDQAQEQRRAREEVEAEAQRQMQIAEDAAAEQAEAEVAPLRPAGESVPQQQPLLSRRQAPALSRSEQIRRGIQQPPSTVGDPTIFDDTPAPVQRELFTRRGRPTVAGRAEPTATLAPGETTGRRDGFPFASAGSARLQLPRVARDTGVPVSELEVITTPQGALIRRVRDPEQAELFDDAVQEPEAAQVPVQPEAEVSPAVAEEVAPEPVQEVAPEPVQEVAPEPVREEGELNTEGVADPEAPPAAPAQTQEVLPETNDAFVESIIEIIETTRSEAQYSSGVASLLDWAGDPGTNAATKNRVFSYLSTLPVDQSLRNGIYDYVVNFRDSKVQATRGGNMTPLFKFIVDAGMFDTLNRKVGFVGLPENMRSEEAAAPAEPVQETEQKDNDRDGDRVEETAVALLTAIKEINARTGLTNQSGLETIRKELTERYAAVVAAGVQDFTNDMGVPVSDYFREDGTPNLVLRDRRARVVTDSGAQERVLTPREELEQWDNVAEAQELASRGLVDFGMTPEQQRRAERQETPGTGRYMTIDGEPISGPMPIGRVRLQVSSFVNKLSVKPRVKVFSNQIDLMAKDLDLYRRAKEQRPQGDFDNTRASGYSFQDNGVSTVIVFADQIMTQQQLNFMLAHETLGHHGLRGLIPATKFNNLMDKLYVEAAPESAMRQHIDAIMNSDRAKSRPEAVEEYLADFAAQLDVSVIARIFSAIKNALNKLGVEFADDAARHLVGQARRYVRNGNRSDFFNISGVVERIHAMENGEDPLGTGRFAPTSTFRDVNAAASLMNLPGMAFDKIGDTFKRNGVDVSGTFDKFKNSVFNLLVFRARENEGLSKVHDVVSQSRDLSMAVRKQMQEKMAPVLDRAMLDRFSNTRGIGGATKAEIAAVNKYLYDGMFYSLSKFDRNMLDGPRLYSINEATGETVPNQPEIDRLFNAGMLTFEQMRDGFSYEETFTNDAGQVVTESKPVPGVEGLTEDSVIWRGYVATREAMRDLELELLKARLVAHNYNVKYALKEFSTVMEGEQLSADNRRLLTSAMRKYKELWEVDPVQDEDGNFSFNPDSVQRANEFLVAFNTAIIATEPSATDTVAQERNAEVAAFFPERTPEDVNQDIEAFKQNRKLLQGDDRFIIQNRIKDLVVSELSDGQADTLTRQTLATGYTPLIRRGGFQITVEAYDESGNRVALPQDYREQLVYRQFEKESEALTMADQMNEMFGTTRYKVQTVKGGELVDTSVTLKAVPAVALDAPASPPQLNLNEFVQGLRYFSIALPPKKLKQVITALTTQNDRARKRLLRSGNPGWDTDALRAIAEHIESRASTIAKTVMRPRLAELTNMRIESTKKLWDGDKAKLNNLQQRYEQLAQDPNANEAAVLQAKTEYVQYKYMYDKTNPASGLKKGNQYFNEASRLLQFIENNRDLSESDFGAGPIASNIRALTSIMQLGGSLATGTLNYLALVTNTLPFLMHRNEKTGFGGGFALGNATKALNKAMNQVGMIKSIRDPRFNTAEFYESLTNENDPAAQALREEIGLEVHEAKFMAAEIREGTMIPAQMNMLTELALGRIKGAGRKKFLEGYMWTFNATERGSRRSAGLAAYRLEHARQIAAGNSPEIAARNAQKFAVDTLRMTLGEYSVTNRPAAWRSGIQSFLYIYKIFPTTSIQLLARLPKKGQLQMLATLWLMSGLQGLPFMQDLEDIIDTIAQRLGFRMGSVRAEAAKLADNIVPGMSPFVLTGLFRAYLPGDVASRTSLGNFIPGTAVFLAGSSTTREVAEMAGPAWSMVSGTFGLGMNTIRAATSRQMSIEDVLREAPMTTARMFGDTLSYLRTGAVVDRRGYVISENAGPATMAARLAGWYPSSAANQYEVIRVSRRINDYQREVSAAYRTAYVRARMRNDQQAARGVLEEVADWNRGARGTALEIRNFRRNAERAYREARRPATDRLIRSAPVGSRGEIREVERLLGYEEYR